MDLSSPYRWLLAIIDPGNLFALVALAWLAANLRRRPTRGSVFAVCVVSVLLLVPVGAWALLPLVERFPRSAIPTRLDGVLVLGGGTENPERLITAAGLLRRFPRATVIFSDVHDGADAREILLRLGIAPAQIAIENRATDTWQNLSFSECLVRPSPGQAWFLVTSSYHMPRAMGVAQRIGWDLKPWPSGPTLVRPVFALEFTDNLRILGAASHEWLGLLTYYFEGKSSSLFPQARPPTSAVSRENIVRPGCSTAALRNNDGTSPAFANADRGKFQ